MKYATFYLSLFAVLVAFGCSDKVQFGGKVIFSDDGAPITSGSLIFVSESEPFQARGVINSDGTYRVSSTGVNDGLPPGTYAIVASAFEFLKNQIVHATAGFD